MPHVGAGKGRRSERLARRQGGGRGELTLQAPVVRRQALLAVQLRDVGRACPVAVGGERLARATATATARAGGYSPTWGNGDKTETETRAKEGGGHGEGEGRREG